MTTQADDRPAERQTDTATRGPLLHHATTAVVAWRRRHPVVTELVLLGSLYVAYSLIRSVAGDDWAAARASASAILRLEHSVGLDVEQTLNAVVHRSEWLSLAASYWYATAHFAVTITVLVLLYWRRRSLYPRLRNALVLATASALVFYLLMPTAPPRLLGPPYVDVLASTARHGWWASSGSTPRAVGGVANELAAFPSMHAGWALWVAAAAFVACTSRLVRSAAVTYALATALDVVATANHWTIDVLAGWVLAAVAVAVCSRQPRASVTGGAAGPQVSPDRRRADAAPPPRRDMP